MTQEDTDQASDIRPYDIIIFGASGSVGQFLVEELALVAEKHYTNYQSNESEKVLSPQDPQYSIALQKARKSSVPRSVKNISWAIAGRSAMRLNECLSRAEISTGIKDLSNQIPTILADLKQEKSLISMCAKTNLIINCVGPFSNHGETVIKSCLETRTNYIDTSHEVTYMDQIRRNYWQKSRDLGVYIVTGCGFQSMSAEMGQNFMKQVVDGEIDEMKIILNLSSVKASTNRQPNGCLGGITGIISPGMWLSLLADKANQVVSDGHQVYRDQTKKLLANQTFEGESVSATEYNPQKDLETRKVLHRKDTQTLVKEVVKLQNRDSFAWLKLFRGFDDAAGKGYCLPTNNITSEESQLIRAEMTNYELRKPDLNSVQGWRPIRSSSFYSVQTLGQLIMLMVWFFFFDILVKFSPIRGLMRTFPYVFSLGNVENPNKRRIDKDSVSHIKYCQTFLAYGTPNDESGDPLEHRDKHLKRKKDLILVSRVVGPEPNHVATATFAIQAGLALALELDHLPTGGGVMTPGAAFSETNIIYQLRRRNIKFEVLKKA